MRRFLTVLFVIATATEVGAWGEEGDRGMADGVQRHLETSTVKAIATIMGTGNTLPPGTLARLSKWPDQIRALTKNPMPPSQDFRRPRWRTRGSSPPPIQTIRWHSVDLPRGATHHPDVARPDPADPALPSPIRIIMSI